MKINFRHKGQAPACPLSESNEVTFAHGFNIYNTCKIKNYKYFKVKNFYFTFKITKGILDFKIRDEEGHIETEIYRSIHLIL